MASGDAALRYHDETSHSPESVRASGHTLDWDIKPFPFKVYTDLAPIPLPRALEPLDVPVSAALVPGGAARAGAIDLESLATLLYYSAGVTKKKADPATWLAAPKRRSRNS